MSLFTILGLVVVSWALLSMVGSERQRLLEAIPKEEDEPADEEKAPVAPAAVAAGAAGARVGAVPAANPVVNSVKKP